MPAHQRSRDSRLHSLLQQAGGTKPMGLKTLRTPGLKLRRRPTTNTKQPQQHRHSASANQLPLTRQTLHHHTTGSTTVIPPLNLHRTRTKRRPRRRVSTTATQNQSLGTPQSVHQQGRHPHQSSARPSTVSSLWDNGPSTLRRRVEAGKRSEWAQIVTKDLHNFRTETAYVKQQKLQKARRYAQDIRTTIDLRASLNNSTLAKAEKDNWKTVLVKEEQSNAIVKRAQVRENKLKALQLKKDRDAHVKILHANRKEEQEYHEHWNEKIVADAKESVALTAATKRLKKKQERDYILRTMKEHAKAKQKLIKNHQKQLNIEQALQNKHNQNVKGEYVTEAERRKRETQRIDNIQTRLMKMGETWVGRDAKKRKKEQHLFATIKDGPHGQSSGIDYEIKVAKLTQKIKKNKMKHRRRELLEQMVLKKERKMKDKIIEADFALHASTEKVKAGMFQAYYDEEKLRKKDMYGKELKAQMERRKKIKQNNPTGIHARMTEHEKTLNSKTLATMGITEHTTTGGGGGIRTKKRRGDSCRRNQSVASGRGPESQIFLNTYEGDASLSKVSSHPIPKHVPVSQAPFHVDTVPVAVAGTSATARSQTPFNAYRRNRDGAHEELMKLSRPGTSNSSLYSSLRHSHNPRKSRSWFDDEL
jgi:hypothetical protein